MRVFFSRQVHRGSLARIAAAHATTSSNASLLARSYICQPHKWEKNVIGYTAYSLSLSLRHPYLSFRHSAQETLSSSTRSYEAQKVKVEERAPASSCGVVVQSGGVSIPVHEPTNQADNAAPNFKAVRHLATLSRFLSSCLTGHETFLGAPKAKAWRYLPTTFFFCRNSVFASFCSFISLSFGGNYFDGLHLCLF